MTKQDVDRIGGGEWYCERKSGECVYTDAGKREDGGECVNVVESSRNHYRVMLSMSMSSFLMRTEQRDRDRRASVIEMNSEDPMVVAKVAR